MLFFVSSGISVCLPVSGEADGETNLIGSAFTDADGETLTVGISVFDGVWVGATETTGDICVVIKGISVAVETGVSVGVSLILGIGVGVGTKFLFSVMLTFWVSRIVLSSSLTASIII